MSKGKKTPKQRETVSNTKSPKNTENPESYYASRPVWSFRRLDNDYCKWGFVHTDNLYASVISKLKDYEGMTWGDIISASGGRSSGNNNHFENVSDLIPEAQKRWKELRLEEYDRVFSLRLTGVYRLYGILSDGIFSIVWFDQCHEIYATKK